MHLSPGNSDRETTKQVSLSPPLFSLPHGKTQALRIKSKEFLLKGFISRDELHCALFDQLFGFKAKKESLLYSKILEHL
jgi:hypothetical protein